MSLLAELDYPARPRHAVFSPCRTYRYALSRVWSADKPYALFIGLNPSTADETLDDPTIRRCIDFAKRWGYGGLVMANLFAYRATEPAVMKRAAEPVGELNDPWLIALAAQAGVVIAAWGEQGAFGQRSAQVRQLIPQLHYLQLNKSGEPRHPLYLKRTLLPQALDGRA